MNFKISFIYVFDVIDEDLNQWQDSSTKSKYRKMCDLYIIQQS